MSDDRPPGRPTGSDNSTAARLILLLGLASALAYLGLALAGDLRQRLPLLFAVYAGQLAVMGVAWSILRRRGAGFAFVIGAALVFRVLAACGGPALSDDVYRYVWDGRVQLHGVQPYSHAPDDPALAELRDANWEKINHRELKTVYPPLAQMLFVVLSAIGLGPFGFQLCLGLIDFGVVLALAYLLRTLGLPRDRLVFYAWNPLAVLETAGSGHIEPLGVALVLLAAAWIIDRRPGLSTLALAGAIQVKLFPVVLVPGCLRRYRLREVALLAAAIVVPFLPYAATGPVLGGGLFDYAQRWEFNSLGYFALQGLFETLDTGERLKPVIAWAQQSTGATRVPWELVYGLAWPVYLARVGVALAASVWIVWLTFRPGLDAARESFLVLAGVLILSPTVHPWYVLWVLPFAAAYLSWPWLAFAGVVVLAYLGGGPAFWVRGAEWATLGGVFVVGMVRRRSASRSRERSGSWT